MFFKIAGPLYFLLQVREATTQRKTSLDVLVSARAVAQAAEKSLHVSQSPAAEPM
jgi:hypothetical protein